jgi:hypothetical protein
LSELLREEANGICQRCAIGLQTGYLLDDQDRIELLT